MTPITPGPWHARPRNIDNDLTQDAIAGLGWDVEGPPEPMLRGQFAKAADAYLAAAAPEILAALERVLPHVGRIGGTIAELDALREAARAAIAKVKGSDPCGA